MIEIDSKYYETEKHSNQDLDQSKEKMKNEIENLKKLIASNQNNEAINALNSFELIIEKYADSYSKNQNIKKESVKEMKE